MRLFLFLLLICLSCKQTENAAVAEAVVSEKDTVKFVKPKVEDPDAECKKALWKLYVNWKDDMLARGEFWPEDSCKQGIVMAPRYENKKTPDWGYPDMEKTHYADLNRDGILDQLVTFEPSQCDGGNASMWTQIQVLTLSDGKTFKTESSIGDGITGFVRSDAGFYHYDSIAPNQVFGTYYEFLDNDGHCCPSIQKKMVMDYTTKQWTFIRDIIVENN